MYGLQVSNTKIGLCSSLFTLLLLGLSLNFIIHFQKINMGKKHRHEKHHKHRLDHERVSVDSSDEGPVLVPKLIVKFGSENTPERHQYSPSPDFAVKEENTESLEHSKHSKEKKKKKKKDKKKHDKDKEHRKKKKRKRDHSYDENLDSYPSVPPQLTPQNHNSPSSPEPENSPKRFCPETGKEPEYSSSVVSPNPLADSKPKSSLCKVLEYLLVMLEKKDVNNFFSNPVSDTIAPGYSTLIKEPMDFSTMREMIETDRFSSLNQFRNAFDLICNNCMTYNGPETVFFKSAKLLQRQGQRILAPERIKALAEHLPLIKELTSEELGFELTEELTADLTPDDEKDVTKFIEEIRVSVSQKATGKFEAIPDTLLPEEILAQARVAAKEAADKLKSKGAPPMGYLKRKADVTTLAMVTPGGSGKMIFALCKFLDF